MPRVRSDSKMTTYKAALVNRYWAYQRLVFPDVETFFERPFAPDGRPPVFLAAQAQHNLIANPEATPEELGHLRQLLPPRERHRWFRSMHSSQALAQSVLGNLALYNHLSLLAELRDDDGEPLFGPAQVSAETFVLEHNINHLGERRRTSLDGFVSGPYQVAIECKFTEAEVGPCSRPSLRPSEANYHTDWCDGSFTRQLNRRERCSLTESGVLYWNYVPALFTWPTDTDLSPCPLHRNYQLVRNILAACVRADSTVAPERGHVVVIYDERNPAFQAGGAGLGAFAETRQALKVKGLLKKCSWQRIVSHLKEEAILPWLTEQLALKYGLG